MLDLTCLAGCGRRHYWLLLCIFSFLGAIHSPFFFLAHLLDFLRALPFSSLARVWSVLEQLQLDMCGAKAGADVCVVYGSRARAWRPLLRTTAVALIILTSLALYAYTFFYSAMNSSGRQCRSPWSVRVACFHPRVSDGHEVFRLT